MVLGQMTLFYLLDECKFKCEFDNNFEFFLHALTALSSLVLLIWTRVLCCWRRGTGYATGSAVAVSNYSVSIN